MLNNMNSGWISWRKEEEFLDNLQKFNHKLECENITGTDKLIMINTYILDLADKFKLKVI